MKCTSCGSNNLIEANHLPCYIEYGDGQLTISKGKVFICAECGHYELYDTDFRDRYKIEIAEKEEIKKEIDLKTKELTELRNIKFNPTPFENEIKRIKSEIQTLDELGVAGKSIRAREDSIKDYENIIKSGIDPKILGEIKRIEFEIKQLNKKVKD